MRKYHRVSTQFSRKKGIEKTGLRSRSEARLKKLKYFLVFIFFGLLSLLISVNVYAASYELLFNKDLPVVSSLSQFSYGEILGSLVGDSSSVGRPFGEFVGDNGEPKELRLPQLEAKIALVPAVQAPAGDFLVRASTGHFFMTTLARNGALGDVVIYAKRDWRSLPANADIAVDDNVFLDTSKDWRYVYRITEAVKGKQAETYLTPTSSRGSIMLVIEGRDGLEVYRGENISLQNVGR